MYYRARTLIAAAACLLAAAVPARAALLAPVITNTSTGSVNVSWTAGTSPYIAVISTSPSFTAPISSGALSATSTGYPYLDPDTTYYFRVNSAVDPAAQTSTATWAAAPGGIYSVSSYFTADSSFTAGASIGWNTNGNPEWTSYDLQYSTDSAFIPAAVSLKGYPPIIMGGLDANTTYYFKVRARGVSGTVTAYTPFISTATLALKLTGLSDTIYETSTTVSWTAVNGASQAEQSEGYRLNLYLNASLASVVRTLTIPAVETSTSLANLARNTTYYYRVGALNLPGTPNLVEPRYFTTLSAVPQNLTVTSPVTGGSATLGWTALAAAEAKGYRLEASSTNFTAGGLIHSSVSYSAALSTLTIPTLDSNTTYYFRVASMNGAFAPNYSAYMSSVTLAQPVSLSLIYVSAEPHSITASFTPMPDSPQAFACEGYRLEGSTSPAAWSGGAATVLSSVTYTYQDQLRSLTLGNLAANTTYYLRLGTLNWERTHNFTLLASTKTGFPGPLTGVSLGSVWSSSGAVSFTPGLSAGGHVAEASVYRYFDSIDRSSATPTVSLSTLVIEALDPNTTYYFRAGALYNGATIYTTASPEFRQTLPKQLTLLTTPEVFRSSITVAWFPRPGTPQSETAESYLLEASTGPAFASPILFSSRTANIGLDRLTIAGLAPNTSYYFRAGTLNQEGSVNYAAIPATSTLANPPVEQGFNLNPNSINMTWLANSNPPDTRYLVELDNNTDFSPILASSITVLSSATFSGLSPNTTYYSRVSAINRLNRMIPPVNFSDMATGAFNPGARAASGIQVSSLAVNWSSGAAAGMFNGVNTYYLARVSSSTDFSGTVLSSMTLALSSTFYGLVSNASYYMSVSALNLTGVPTDPPVALGTALTMPATAYILSQAGTYSDMKIDGFSVNWDDNGNSSSTVYRVDISTASDFSVLSDSRAVQAETCPFSNLTIDTVYWARVQARGQTGILSAFESAGFTQTLSSSNLSAVALQDSVITLETSYGQISVHLPPGSIGSSTVLTLRPSTSAFAPPLSAVSDLDPTGIGVIITHSPPTLILSAITITLPYRIADLPAGTDRARLILALFDEGNSIWVPLPSVSDTANNRVIGQTWHLSTFQIMQAHPEAGLSEVKIYPNPYRPNSVSDVMHFTNMTPYAKVRIYTFLGELVREVTADVNGMAHWDGLNKSGRKAASGVYIAFIQSKDKKSEKSFKVALER